MPVLRNQVSLDLLHHLLEFCLGSSNVRLATLKRIRTGDIIIVQKLYNLLLCNQVIIGDYIVNDNNEAKLICQKVMVSQITQKFLWHYSIMMISM